MNWDAIGAIAEMLSAISVLVTLIYLAVQVRETGKAITINALQTNRVARLDWFKSQRESNHMPAIFEKLEEGKELTYQERYRLDWAGAESWGLVYADWLQRKLLIGDDYLTSPDSLFGPNMVRLWRESASKVFPPEFVADMNGLIDEWEKDA